MSERTVVRYEGGAIHVSEPDPTEELLITNARLVAGHAAPLLDADRMTRREARFTALELVRCVRDLLVIVGHTRD
ncbi:hypothetical protein [Streptomyces poonensis]|uniref:Uncharacterized protein n=1 Tax=Streptomyces poonensis TaxID=68255 RepID=A0A918UDL5_9ACTN|nr:hypothetical protein [Streptomyces poonensis]GGY93749.1 hypothetical protein GCM10010365_10490 [Streptomyces poonensis]GLJ87511.1 hypothetical protein GCM10017589_01110 [Streptomyces poonensis]